MIFNKLLLEKEPGLKLFLPLHVILHLPFVFVTSDAWSMAEGKVNANLKSEKGREDQRTFFMGRYLGHVCSLIDSTACRSILLGPPQIKTSPDLRVISSAFLFNSKLRGQLL
jgi:hypothetical protein